MFECCTIKFDAIEFLLFVYSVDCFITIISKFLAQDNDFPAF